MPSRIVFSKVKGLVCLNDNGEVIHNNQRKYYSQRRMTKGFKEYFVRCVEEETGQKVCNLHVIRDWDRINQNGDRVSTGYKIEFYRKDSDGLLTKFYTAIRTNPK